MHRTGRRRRRGSAAAVLHAGHDGCVRWWTPDRRAHVFSVAHVLYVVCFIVNDSVWRSARNSRSIFESTGLKCSIVKQLVEPLDAVITTQGQHRPVTRRRPRLGGAPRWRCCGRAPDESIAQGQCQGTSARELRQRAQPHPLVPHHHRQLSALAALRKQAQGYVQPGVCRLHVP